MEQFITVYQLDLTLQNVNLLSLSLPLSVAQLISYLMLLRDINDNFQSPNSSMQLSSRTEHIDQNIEHLKNKRFD